MGIPRSRVGYDDVRQVLDTALSSEKGLKLDFEDRRAAVAFRQRIYAARAADKANRLGEFDEANPGYVLSPYDDLVVQLDGTELKLLKGKPFKMEDL